MTTKIFCHLRPCLFLILFLLPAANLFAEYFVIERFDVDIRLDQSGFFEVTETIDVRFTEQRHGIYRDIPYKYQFNGESYKIDIYDIEVEGHKFKTMWEGRNRRIRIGDPDRYVDGQQRYVIRYKVEDAWLFEEEHTEFYWNITGNDWPVEMEEINYAIHLPESPPLSEEDYRRFTGRRGTQGTDATITYQNGTLSGESTRTYQPGEGLTVAIRLPVDYIERPSEMEVFLSRYGLLSVPLALLGLLAGLWFRHGKEDDFVKMVHYYPPDNISPAEAGAFIDDKTDNRDLTCLIPYWAGQGFLEMQEHEEKKLLIFTDTDYEFIKIKDLPADRPDYERTIFNGLFRDGDSVRLSDLKNSFYKKMSKARSQLQHSVRDKQLHTPRSRMIWGLLPVGAVLCFGLGPFLMFFFEQYVAGAATVATGIIAFIVRRPMLKKNKQGMEIYQQLYGFRMFVDKADKDRIKRLLEDDPSYFEKTLPFAIAFGMTEKWTNQFAGLFTEPPRWYHSAYAHRQGPYQNDSFQAFAGNFDSSMREVQSVFTSRPSSSGSGGVSGGSSGGGFGGGGGGSW